MKVKQLIEKLNELPEDANIFIEIKEFSGECWYLSRHFLPDSAEIIENKWGSVFISFKITQQAE